MEGAGRGCGGRTRNAMKNENHAKWKARMCGLRGVQKRHEAMSGSMARSFWSGSISSEPYLSRVVSVVDASIWSTSAPLGITANSVVMVGWAEWRWGSG